MSKALTWKLVDFVSEQWLCPKHQSVIHSYVRFFKQRSMVLAVRLWHSSWPWWLYIIIYPDLVQEAQKMWGVMCNTDVSTILPHNSSVRGSDTPEIYQTTKYHWLWVDYTCSHICTLPLCDNAVYALGKLHTSSRRTSVFIYCASSHNSYMLRLYTACLLQVDL